MVSTIESPLLLYDALFERLVMPCVRLIEEKQFEVALILYKTITMKLKTQISTPT